MRTYVAAILILLMTVLQLLSCKKEFSCENGCDNNQPPVANAGSDKIIRLLIDTSTLDGSLSNDPDGFVASYKWKKISGKDTVFIQNDTDSITILNGLKKGSYMFELTVSDNGGLEDKDTVQFFVADPNEPNLPPIADAGSDTTIIIPDNEVILDGTKSSDPENNIVSYNWSKLSGPTVVFLKDSTLIKSSANSLVEGIYLFELKVTDAGGLFAFDTVQVTVSNPDNTLTCNLTMTPFNQLPEAGGVSFTIAAGNKILFFRYGEKGLVDIYDTSTRSWSSKTEVYVSYPNLFYNKPVIVGNKILFSRPDTLHGYQVVDIYDASSNSWKEKHLPEIREDYACAVAGNKVVYAGGHNYKDVSKKLDIYDALTNSWSVMPFNEARMQMRAGGIGNRIYIAGGFISRQDSLILSCDDFGNNCTQIAATQAVDHINVLDMNNNSWSEFRLKEARGRIEILNVNDQLFFVSGYHGDGNQLSSMIDIYNNSSGSWTSQKLTSLTYPSEYYLGAYSVGEKILLSFGSSAVCVYDIINHSDTRKQLTPKFASMQQQKHVATLGHKIVFFTVHDDDSNSKNVDIYDALTNSWCHTQLNKGLWRSGIIGYGNRVYVAGGFRVSGSIPIDFQDSLWYLNF